MLDDAPDQHHTNDTCGAAPHSGKQEDDSPLGKETDGPKGPEPTRFGDWERKGRCIDF
ncbi:MAG: DUF1674 domain-containing protein [Methylomonas sp.]|nr:DUF1674 domain-containing protein [Methylomonas sp.]PPD20069.1 MAG: DUF1674 domain-containing protein [Methylomonas sp.]PPD25990.1 MAG: DUF1674 domain-containing protein [Methylomonas sp.]PPD37719.1 MAG: DUF1674 domain-containing protein [Methylomonas sp.]PPD39601.1 MAG: DUF1674 domain-containing protein [Methylomonas sp.]